MRSLLPPSQRVRAPGSSGQGWQSPGHLSLLFHDWPLIPTLGPGIPYRWDPGGDGGWQNLGRPLFLLLLGLEKHSSGQSGDTCPCAMSGGHPPQTNMTPGSAHAKLALPCWHPACPYGTCLPAWPDPQQGSPVSPLETAWVTACWDLSPAPSSPPGWRGGEEGQDIPVRSVPSIMQRRVLSHRDMSGPCSSFTPHLVLWSGGRRVITSQERLRILQLLNDTSRGTG